MDIRDDIELQDCPYCGGVGMLEEEHGWCWYVVCSDCGGQTASCGYGNEQERAEAARKVAELWNRGKILRGGFTD